MSAASPVLTGSAIHDQQDVAINQHEPPSSSNRSNHAEESQRAENLLVPESEHPISSEHAGPFTELGPDDVNVNSDQRQEHPEYAAYEPHILYDNSPSVDYPMSPIAARGMYNLRSRGSGRSRGNARPKRLPLTQLQPLHLANQNPNTVPPMILQHGPGWPPHASPTMLKAACSPMSQKSSIVSSPRHEELFDVMSPHSTAGSMSPGYVRGHGLNYGRPPSTSGSKNRGSHLRTPSELQGSHFDMPLPQYSPAQTPIVRNSSFMRLHDGTHTPEPSNAQPTGYSHIASRLAGRLPDERGPPIQPLYRRFQELNHRMLLHLQDEVSQLEERLHRLDNRSTQDRQTYSGHTLPESRRAEESMSGELYRRRTDLLGQIGFKLQAYSKLRSRGQTQHLGLTGLQTTCSGHSRRLRRYLARRWTTLKTTASSSMLSSPLTSWRRVSWFRRTTCCVLHRCKRVVLPPLPPAGARAWTGKVSRSKPATRAGELTASPRLVKTWLQR